MFEDIINAITSQFTGPVTIPMIGASLVESFIISLYIIFIYRKTFSGVVYNRTMTLTISLLAMVTAMIIRTINSNLSLSLGMVGALSIVRFRTAVKEPVDTTFMFWAITAGIMSGAGLYVVAIVASLVLGLCYYLLYMFGAKAKSQYLLVVMYNLAVEGSVESILDQISRKKLKSKTINSQNIAEVTFEINYGKDIDELMVQLQKTEGVRTVNLVSYNNDFGL